MATLAEIAKIAGVSPAVVSRIMNEDKTLRVAQETRARVLRVAGELDYSPNIAAQSLRKSKSGMLAFILHDISNPVYGPILRSAQREAAERGLAILLGDGATGGASMRRLAHLIGGGGVDGVILQSGGDVSDEVLLRAARRDTPVVLLQHALGDVGTLITLPDEEAATLATRHMLGLGHRKIGCVATREFLSLTDARLRGWRTTMGDAATDAVIYAGSNSEEGERATRELLSARPDLTGLVCFNVVAAVGALRAARALGREVPKDLSIIALHDAPFAGDLHVPLSVVAMPVAEMGRLAIGAVCDPMSGSGKVITVTSPPEIVIRASTAPPV